MNPLRNTSNGWCFRVMLHKITVLVKISFFSMRWWNNFWHLFKIHKCTFRVISNVLLRLPLLRLTTINLFLRNSARYDETGNKLLELAPNPGFHKQKYHKKHVKSVLFDIHIMLKCSYLSPGFFSFFRLTQQNARASFNTWITSHSWLRTQHHCTMINSVSLRSPRHESFDHRGLHRRDRKQKKRHMYEVPQWHTRQAAQAVNTPHNTCTCKTKINTEPDKDKVIKNRHGKNGN